MKIGGINVTGRLALAPMSKVTSLPFRLLSRRYGCGLLYSEMINANALVRDNKSTIKKSITSEEDHPVAMQLFGTKENLLVEAAKKLPSDFVDINFGCPDHDVVCTGAGSALLKRPEKIRKIISALAAGQDKPVTAKIRIGLDKEKINAVEIAKIIEEAGAAAIAVHGRTVAQKYSGKADWSVIRAVKESVSIPVIANGDITDEISAENCLKETKADAVMIGRAAIGDPYLFRRISHYLETGELLPKQTLQEKTRDFFTYLSLCREYDCLNYAELKTHAQWFTKSAEGGKNIRERITKADTIEKIIEIMKEIES